MSETEPFRKLQENIQYTFQDMALLKQALTHSSYSNEVRLKRFENNERLEFLGDAVLEVSVSEYLYKTYLNMKEGELTKLRASIVCEPSLAFCARLIELGTFIYLGRGEESTGGRERDSILSDALEALIGAIYLDGSFCEAKAFVERIILEDLEHKKLFFDSKTILQEMVQSIYKKKLCYELLQEEGPDHCKKFTVLVRMGKEALMEGTGRTKKAAEQEAAYRSILLLQQKKKDGQLFQELSPDSSLVRR